MRNSVLLSLALVAHLEHIRCQVTHEINNWSPSTPEADKNLNISVGDSVHWTWGGNHYVRADSFQSHSSCRRNAEYTHTFNDAGDFDFRCPCHPSSMDGTISVFDVPAPVPAPIPMPIPVPGPEPVPAPVPGPTVVETQVPTPPTLPEDTPDQFVLINWQIGVGVGNVLEVEPGTTVLWNWTDPGRTHTVTETGHMPSLFNSDEHLTPFAFWFQFGEEYAGQSIPYRCNVHPTAMIGEIRVGRGSLGAASLAQPSNILTILCVISAGFALFWA